MVLRKWLVATALVVAAATPAAAQKASVVNYWTSGGESRAVAVLAKAYDKAGGDWVDVPAIGPQAEQALVLSRMTGGVPPTAMQWSVGIPLQQLADQGLLNNLDEIAKSQHWDQHLPPVVTKGITFGGHVYAAPVDIGGVNYSYYSIAVFKKLGMTPPTTWQQFFAEAPKMQAAGIIPLAFGANAQQENWLFMALLAGVGGADVYRQVLVEHNAKVAGSDAVKRVFEAYGKLRQYVDAGSPNRKWNDTLALVETNKAALMIVGDWASGDFAANKLEYGKDFGCILSPGTQGQYVMVADSFAFPKSSNKEQIATGQKLASVLMDPAVQTAFNIPKGSLPALLNAKLDGLDPCAKIGHEVMSEGASHQLADDYLTFTPNDLGEIYDLLADYWTQPSMSATAATKRFAQIIDQAKAD